MIKGNFLEKVRSYISPVYLIMLFAAFVLWYIAKLNYVYTTDLKIDVEIANNEFEVECVVEGIGTNLFGYRLYKGANAEISLKNLQYRRSQEQGHQDMLIIDPQSLQNVLAVKYSDIKVISIGTIPEINVPLVQEEKLLRKR